MSIQEIKNKIRSEEPFLKEKFRVKKIFCAHFFLGNFGRIWANLGEFGRKFNVGTGMPRVLQFFAQMQVSGHHNVRKSAVLRLRTKTNELSNVQSE